jgi:RNA-directed DNA polymerase
MPLAPKLGVLGTPYGNRRVASAHTDMRTRRSRPIAEALAAAFLTSDEWTARTLALHGAEALGVTSSERPQWLRDAAKRATVHFDEPPRARFRDLVRTIQDVLHSLVPLRIARFPVPALAMADIRFPVPPLATSGELAQWLSITTNELVWFADPRGLERLSHAAESLRHYRYRWVRKRAGGYRLLEAPKPRTKRIQQRILHGLLDVVPAHAAAHGFVAGRSPRTHAERHAGSAIVIRLDLADFFLHVGAAHVRAIFAALGYPDEVAWNLTCLTTNVAPVRPRALTEDDVSHLAAIRRAEMLARTRHLPQGAPTSPALANLAAFALDVRLAAAAERAGARYSRYADDLVFSGDATFARSADAFARLVTEIAVDEGFPVNRSKTRFMRRGARQVVTGIVVNERPTIARRDVDRLEALLFNCVRHGQASQNRVGYIDFRSQLRGRIAYVASIDPKRAARLVVLFEKIDWSAS